MKYNSNCLTSLSMIYWVSKANKTLIYNHLYNLKIRCGCWWRIFFSTWTICAKFMSNFLWEFFFFSHSQLKESMGWLFSKFIIKASDQLLCSCVQLLHIVPIISYILQQIGIKVIWYHLYFQQIIIKAKGLKIFGRSSFNQVKISVWSFYIATMKYDILLLDWSIRFSLWQIKM